MSKRLNKMNETKLANYRARYLTDISRRERNYKGYDPDAFSCENFCAENDDALEI